MRLKIPSTPLTLSMLSGILIGTSTIPLPPWALFFCLSPLMWIWLNEKPIKVFFYTSLTFFIASLIGFFWISSLLQKFAKLPFVISILALLLFCFLCHITLAVAGYTYAKWIRNRTKQPILALCALISFVWLISPMLFPWDLSINWIYGGLKGFEFMDLIGSKGIHSITVFLNGAFLFSFLNWKKDKSLKPFYYTLSFVIIFNTFGWFYSLIPTNKKTETFHLTLVQANIGNIDEAYKRFGNNFRLKTLDTYLDLSEKALTDKTKLIVWPETAYPATYYPGFKYHYLAKKTFAFLKIKKTPLLTGMFSQMEKNKTSNSAVLFSQDGEFPIQPIKKVHLLAFGEYLPGEGVFPFLRKLFPMVGDFDRGLEPIVSEISGVKVGLQICYEALFSDFSRQLSQKNAQILINLTNDSWYGRYSEPYQHMYSALAKSIETRLPIVRVTNTGISALLTPEGSILHPSPINKAWSKSIEIPYQIQTKKTFFVRLGHLLTLPLLLIMFILSVTYGKK